MYGRMITLSTSVIPRHRGGPARGVGDVAVEHTTHARQRERLMRVTMRAVQHREGDQQEAARERGDDLGGEG